MKREAKILVWFLVIFALIFVVLAFALNWFGGNIMFAPEGQGENYDGWIGYENIERVLLETDIVNLLPEGGSVLLNFYDDSFMCGAPTEKSYVMTKGNVTEGTLENPGYTISLNPVSLRYGYSYGLCRFLREVNVSGRMSVGTTLSAEEQASYYESLTALDACLEAGKTSNLRIFINYSTFLGLVVGDEREVSLSVVNQGDGIARDAVVEFYAIPKIAEEGETFADIFIGSANISELGAGEETEITFDYTPKKKGDVGIYATVASDDDRGDYWDKHDFNRFLIRSDGFDGRISEYGVWGRIVEGGPSYAYAQVENAGTEKIENANLSIYLNGEIVGSALVNRSVVSEVMKEGYITDEGYESYYHIVEFNSPDELEDYANLSAYLDVSGDLDTSDNSIDANESVLQVRTINLMLTDSDGKNVSNIFTVSDGGYEGRPIFLNRTTQISIVEYPYHGSGISFGYLRWINDSLGFDGNEYNIKELAMLYLENIENIPDDVNITWEHYDLISQNSVNYYYVSVGRNNFESDYSGASIVLDESSVSALGMSKSLDSYAIFGCGEFNFSDGKCAGEWAEADYSYGNKEIGEGMNRFQWEGRFVSGGIEAFGLSESTALDIGYIGQDDYVCGFEMRGGAYGQIEIPGALNITRLREHVELLESAVRVSARKISINTTELFEFRGVPAILTFKNIDLRNPKVYRDGTLCPAEICRVISYNRTSGLFVVNITGFSDYEVREGPYCGDGSCQASEGETCNSCVGDCGSCAAVAATSATSGTGSSTGSPSGGSCLPNWSCSWGSCVNGQQNYVCVKTNPRCPLNIRKPANQTRACFEEADCNDDDGDGYGLGVDCTGRDLDDDDPGVTTFKEDPQVLEPTRGKALEINWIIVAIIGGALILVIVVVLVFVLRKKPAAGQGMRYGYDPAATQSAAAKAKNDTINQAKPVVRRARQNGYTDAQIRMAFKGKGWTDLDIDSLMR